jgi:hypothetical protein
MECVQNGTKLSADSHSGVLIDGMFQLFDIAREKMHGHLEVIPKVADGCRSPGPNLAAWTLYELDFWLLTGKLVDALLMFLPLDEQRLNLLECAGVVSNV